MVSSGLSPEQRMRTALAAEGSERSTCESGCLLPAQHSLDRMMRHTRKHEFRFICHTVICVTGFIQAVLHAPQPPVTVCGLSPQTRSPGAWHFDQHPEQQQRRLLSNSPVPTPVLLHCSRDGMRLVGSLRMRFLVR